MKRSNRWTSSSRDLKMPRRTTLRHLAGEDSEPDFYLVEPTGMGRPFVFRRPRQGLLTAEKSHYRPRRRGPGRQLAVVCLLAVIGLFLISQWANKRNLENSQFFGWHSSALRVNKIESSGNRRVMSPDFPSIASVMLSVAKIGPVRYAPNNSWIYVRCSLSRVYLPFHFGWTEGSESSVVAGACQRISSESLRD